jgi:hypothetical protein
VKSGPKSCCLASIAHMQPVTNFPFIGFSVVAQHSFIGQAIRQTNFLSMGLVWWAEHSFDCQAISHSQGVFILRIVVHITFFLRGKHNMYVVLRLLLHWAPKVLNLKLSACRRYIATCRRGDAKKLEFLCSYLADLSLLDYDCTKFKPSVVAAACLFVARFTINPNTRPWVRRH